MTSHDFFQLVRHRWYLYAIFTFGAVAAAFLLGAGDRIYTTQASISFNPPNQVANTISYGDYAETMIAFTGVVEESYNSQYASVRLSSPTASLFGNGVRSGVSVDVSKVGNQWVTGFDRPIIKIQVSGNSAEAVLKEIDMVSGRIYRISDRLQEDAKTPQSAKISASVEDNEININSFGITRTGKYKGTLALVAVSVVLATLVATGVEYASSHTKRIRPDKRARHSAPKPLLNARRSS